MIEIELRGDIATPEDGAMLRMMGFEDTVCSAESIRNALASAPDDPDVWININSCGGMTSEGLAIYDILRTSGKNIHTNIIGKCHSMAVCILLAAPSENRTANPNARALIHKVHCPAYGDMTAEDAIALAQYIAQEEDAILDIYEERTSQPRDVLEKLMDAEEMQDAEALLKYGFISRINSYNTNKFKSMANKNSNASRWTRFLANARNSLGLEPRNYDYTDGDGKVVFSTDGDDDEVLKVGTVVRLADGNTSGTFVLGDGRRVKIEDNVVVEIEEANTEDAARIAELENLVQEGIAVAEELTNRNRYLEAENRRLSTENGSLRNHVQSMGQPRGRLSNPGGRNNAAPDIEELKARAREGRQAFRGKSNSKN